MQVLGDGLTGDGSAVGEARDGEGTVCAEACDEPEPRLIAEGGEDECHGPAGWPGQGRERAAGCQGVLATCCEIALELLLPTIFVASVGVAATRERDAVEAGFGDGEHGTVGDFCKLEDDEGGGLAGVIVSPGSDGAGMPSARRRDAQALAARW